jgi:hypothetical protein
MQKNTLAKFNISSIKALNKLGTERTCLNVIKSTYDKYTVNILSGEKLKTFPLKSGMR